MTSYTKKDLQKEFGISDNTVTANLKACQLNTGKQKYSQEEHDRFALCRQMFQEGKNAKEVEEYFIELDRQATQEQEVQEVQEAPKPDLATTLTSQQATNATNTINSLVATTITNMVEKGVKDITPYIPAIVVSSINAHLNPEQIMEAMEQIYSDIDNQHEDGGASFFTQIIEVQASQQQPQLPEGQKQPQLPQASPKSSTDSP